MSLLSWLQGDLNLNICEAHAFNTKDKFSLDVFVVNGWRGEVRSCTPTSWAQLSGAASSEMQGLLHYQLHQASRNSWVIYKQRERDMPDALCQAEAASPIVGR